jgi:hypothetical protein
MKLSRHRKSSAELNYSFTLAETVSQAQGNKIPTFWENWGLSLERNEDFFFKK